VILPEEVTGALDAENQAAVTHGLLRLRGHRTILVIAHQLHHRRSRPHRRPRPRPDRRTRPPRRTPRRRRPIRDLLERAYQSRGLAACATPALRSRSAYPHRQQMRLSTTVALASTGRTTSVRACSSRPARTLARHRPSPSTRWAHALTSRGERELAACSVLWSPLGNVGDDAASSSSTALRRGLLTLLPSNASGMPLPAPLLRQGDAFVGDVGVQCERCSGFFDAAGSLRAHTPGECQLADAARTAIVGACHRVPISCWVRNWSRDHQETYIDLVPSWAGTAARGFRLGVSTQR
jgi:hypothetical protein